MRQAQFLYAILPDEASALRRGDRDRALTLQAELLVRIDALSQQRLESEGQLKAVYASTSWRLTGPGRLTVDWLRGILFPSHPRRRGRHP